MSDPVFSAPAVWYDGINALRHEGELRWSPPGRLELIEHGKAIELPASDLRFAGLLGDRTTYSRASMPDFRLRLPRDIPAGLARNLPSVRTYGGWIDRYGLGRMTVAFGIVSAVAVAAFMTAPRWLGPIVPFSWERRMGDAMLGDLGNRLCSTPASEAALAKLMREIAPGERRIRAGIANLDMINAVALPGGRVLLFKGIIGQAKSPDELAGVLAHEVGHVQQRHVMTALLRQFGLSILLSGANSGMTNTAFGIASIGYTRSAEEEADGEARKALGRADISPVATAALFDRLAKEAGESADEGKSLSGWLASHPASRDRARKYRADAKPGRSYHPALSAEEFAALKNACRDDKDVESFDPF